MINPFSRLQEALVSEEVAEILARLPDTPGRFSPDPWGFDKNKTKAIFASSKWLYDHYFRVTTSGIDNVPEKGRVLLVANHSGQLPTDGVLIAVALASREKGPRVARAMIERFFPTVPFVGTLMNQLGAVTGDPANCRRMLEDEAAIIVFPEGVRGSGKLFSDRYKLQRFGHGFMHLAIKYRTPVVPIGVVGCEETMPSIANIAPLAKLLGVPYVPVAPPLPLPAKVSLHFGAPMRFDEAGAERDIAVNVESVKTEIDRLIKTGLAERSSIF